ncbi:MAG: hypothetical protein R3E39_09080 [Anaerolineae bacterium]
MRTLKTTLDPQLLDKIRRFICDFDDQFGYPPNLREIATHVFISRSNLYRYLDHLEMEGSISREPGVARGITILEGCEKKQGS